MLYQINKNTNLQRLILMKTKFYYLIKYPIRTILDIYKQIIYMACSLVLCYKEI